MVCVVVGMPMRDLQSILCVGDPCIIWVDLEGDIVIDCATINVVL